MDNLKELLECDPLADAEQLTGKSYKSDEATVNLGMAMMFLNNQKKQQAQYPQYKTKPTISKI